MAPKENRVFQHNRPEAVTHESGPPGSFVLRRGRGFLALPVCAAPPVVGESLPDSHFGIASDDIYRNHDLAVDGLKAGYAQFHSSVGDNAVEKVGIDSHIIFIVGVRVIPTLLKLGVDTPTADSARSCSAATRR